MTTTTTLKGHEVITADNGNCWDCESNDPGEPMQMTVGGLIGMKVGVCESCAKDLEKQ